MRVREQIMLWVFVLLMAIGRPCCAEDLPILKGGWYLWVPYQYPEDEHSSNLVKGLDIAFQKSISRLAGYRVDIPHAPWREHVDAVAKGKKDYAVGATRTEGREQFAYFSIPYRREYNSFFLRKSFPLKKKIDSVEILLSFLEEEPDFRLGVVDGFVYADSKINAYVSDPKNAPRLFRISTEKNCIEHVVSNKIDGFLADRITASAAAWQMGQSRSIKEEILNVSTPIHFMFSKKTVSSEVVQRFNHAIEKLIASGEYGRIMSDQLFSVLLQQAISQKWFFIIDFLGTVAFAISGLVIAYKERATFLGTLLMSALPSVGGGIVRDILVNRPQLGVMVTPVYLYIIGVTVVLGFIGVRFYGWLRRAQPHKKPSEKSRQVAIWIVQICDALGLAAYTITGVIIAVISKLQPLWLWGGILAFVTGAGGGVLRDLLRSDRQISALQSELYGEVALVWGGMFGWFVLWQSQDLNVPLFFNSIYIVLGGAFLTRILAAYFGLKSITFVSDRSHGDDLVVPEKPAS